MANIKISQVPKTIGGYISYNGSAWTISTANSGITIGAYTAGKLSITHEDMGAGSYLGNVNCRGGKYSAELGSIGATSTEIEFYDPSGVLVTTPTTDMKAYFTRSSPSTIALNPLNIVDGNGNIWLHGVFEIN